MKFLGDLSQTLIPIQEKRDMFILAQAERRKARSGKPLSPVGRSAQRLAQKTSPSGETNTTSRLPDDQSGDWRKPSRPESGAISHSRACFASESRQERTDVRDWRIERRKARSGKARSLRVQKKRGCRLTAS